VDDWAIAQEDESCVKTNNHRRPRLSQVKRNVDIDLSGVWSADLLQSKLLGPAPAALVARIEHSGETLEQELTARMPDGTESRHILQCHIGGHEENASVDGKLVRGGARWNGNELVIELWIAAGNRELHLCDYWSLSAAGQVLTMEHRDDDLAGQRTVFRRTA
jgi:hypothetical protein